jgi:hypothetical protein
MGEAWRVLEEGGEFVQGAPGMIGPRFAGWIAGQYLLAAAKLREAGSGGEGDWRRLREICQDVALLRQTDNHNARVAFERERLRIANERLEIGQRRLAKKLPQTREDMLEEMRRLADDPVVHEELFPTDATPEERLERIRQVFGLKGDLTTEPREDKNDALTDRLGTILFGENWKGEPPTIWNKVPGPAAPKSEKPNEPVAGETEQRPESADGSPAPPSF